MKFDLHVHTYYSDGLNSPKEVIDHAIEAGLSGIAITDHDTVLGIEEALAYSETLNDFYVIPGIELSCIFNNQEVHLLGYFINYKDQNILSATNNLREHRKNRVVRILEKLDSLNIKLDINKLQSSSNNDFVGRVAVAREMINNGYCKSIQEAFDKYLNPGKPAYVERFKLSLKDGISLIREAGGIAIIAHPGLLKDKYIVQECIRLGIDGIESIHSKHSSKQAKYYKDLALRNNLISTAGSDCHGDLYKGELLLGKYFIDINTIPEMKERII